MDLLKYLLLLLISNYAISQEPVQEQDYSKTDSIARTVIYKNDLKLLVSDLTKNCTSELEEARSIFVWIANNIAYDIKAYNKNKRDPFKCKGHDCKEKYVKWEDNLIRRTLTKKMAVCEGYSRLFKKMCDYAGLRTDLVSGYIKNDPSQVGRMGALDHAWNGIMINGKYYYLDVTWAAGGCSIDNNGKLMGFHKDFANYYWLTPADKFFRDHFPEDINLPHVMNNSKQKYMNAPYIEQASIQFITVVSPETGVLSVKLGDTIHFAIQHEQKIFPEIQLNTNTNPAPSFRQWKDNSWHIDPELLKRHKSISYKKDNSAFKFYYVADNKNLRHIDIYFDHQHTLRFKVKVIKDAVTTPVIP